MIVEIALGIVLAVLVLAFLPLVLRLAAGLLVVVVCLAVLGVILFTLGVIA